MSDCANGGRNVYDPTVRCEIAIYLNDYREKPRTHVFNVGPYEVSLITVNGKRWVPAPDYVEKCEVLD